VFTKALGSFKKCCSNRWVTINIDHRLCPL